MKGYCYDIETYRYIFTFTAINVEDRSEVYKWYVHESHNDLMQILQFINQNIYLIGFNNISFDNTVMNYIIIRIQDFKSVDDFLRKVHEFATKVIETQDMYADEEIKIYRWYKPKYQTIDLFRIAYENDERINLKQTAINLKYPIIQDLPIPITAPINVEDCQEVLEYNLNDVNITLSLYDYLKEKITYRFKATSLYNTNLINCNKSQIGDKVMIKLYSTMANTYYEKFKGLRTHHRQIKVSDCLDSNINFTMYELNELLKRFSNKVIKDTHNELKDRVKIGNTWYALGTGGLHSEDYPTIFKADNTTIIRDADVGSFYPTIVVNLKLKPAHLSDVFIDLANYLVTERLAAKAAGDTVTADTLKICINSSLFGKFGSEYSWVYDRKAMVSVTFNGQLYLISLIEQLTLAGFNVISANTDGIVTIIPKDKLSQYDEICKLWQDKFNFNLEYTDYCLYVRRDVNNYFTVKPNGKIKAKGDFITEIDIAKGYDKPIVAIALQNYFKSSIPIMTTLLNHKNIYDFCMSVKAGNQFKFVYHRLDVENAKLKVDILQKNVRFYASMNGGTLFKEEKYSKELTSVCSGQRVTIYNRHIEQENMANYCIDYNYYRIAIQKIIDIIECSTTNKKKIMQRKDQLKLF